MDRHVRPMYEDQSRRDLIGEPGAEPDPRRLLAVAGEGPSACQSQVAVAVLGHLAQGGEHGRVRLVGIGEHVGGAIRGEVASEEVRPETDGCSPCGTAIDCSDLLDHLNGSARRRCEPSQFDWQQEPVDATGRQRRHDCRVEVARLVRGDCPLGDERQNVAAESGEGCQRGRHRRAFLSVRRT